MPLVRLASLDDYEAFDLHGRTMYRVRWCDMLCPGSPADDPAEGLIRFNEWQCAVAAGHEEITAPGEKLALIVAWCLRNKETPNAKQLARDIVGLYKRSGKEVGLQFDTTTYEEPALSYRYELAFLQSHALELPASTILELQNICEGGHR